MINSFKRARLILGLTQVELADKLGISPVSVYKWEHGLGLPKAKRLNEVASVLQTTVEELLRESEEKEVS